MSDLSELELILRDRLGIEWFNFLRGEINSNYFLELSKYISQRRKVTTVYPLKEEVFTAYKLCKPQDVKVVILGQDCYINDGEAHGLAFSVKDELRSTPSILKIKESIEETIYNGLNVSWSNNLTRWAEQGVFLLNTILTVDKGQSLSHANKGWEQFTLETLQTINLECQKNIVFLLFGAYAKNYRGYINSFKHLVIECEHPAAAAYNKRNWVFNDCWNVCNNYLIEHNKEKIIW